MTNFTEENPDHPQSPEEEDDDESTDVPKPQELKVAE